MLTRYTNYFGSLQEYLSEKPTISEITAFLVKNNFKIVKKISDIPISYKEGSLFISSKNIWKL